MSLHQYIRSSLQSLDHDALVDIVLELQVRIHNTELDLKQAHMELDTEKTQCRLFEQAAVRAEMNAHASTENAAHYKRVLEGIYDTVEKTCIY